MQGDGIDIIEGKAHGLQAYIYAQILIRVVLDDTHQAQMIAHDQKARCHRANEQIFGGHQFGFSLTDTGIHSQASGGSLPGGQVVGQLQRDLGLAIGIRDDLGIPVCRIGEIFPHGGHDRVPTATTLTHRVDRKAVYISSHRNPSAHPQRLHTVKCLYNPGGVGVRQSQNGLVDDTQ